MIPASELPPELQVEQWFNTPEPLTLASLRGRVVVVHVFQMLCPACVVHSLPQAQQIRAAFPEQDVVVMGLHSVFEHHHVMTPQALQAFIHEYRLTFPIGIDQPSTTSLLPLTLQAYGLRGTPSLLLIDREGRLHLNHFGHLDDLRVGVLLGQLLAQTPAISAELKAELPTCDAACDAKGCAMTDSTTPQVSP